MPAMAADMHPQPLPTPHKRPGFRSTSGWRDLKQGIRSLTEPEDSTYKIYKLFAECASEIGYFKGKYPHADGRNDSGMIKARDKMWKRVLAKAQQIVYNSEQRGGPFAIRSCSAKPPSLASPPIIRRGPTIKYGPTAIQYTRHDIERLADPLLSLELVNFLLEHAEHEKRQQMRLVTHEMRKLGFHDLDRERLLLEAHYIIPLKGDKPSELTLITHWLRQYRLGRRLRVHDFYRQRMLLETQACLIDPVKQQPNLTRNIAQILSDEKRDIHEEWNALEKLLREYRRRGQVKLDNSQQVSDGMAKLRVTLFQAEHWKQWFADGHFLIVSDHMPSGAIQHCHDVIQEHVLAWFAQHGHDHAQQRTPFISVLPLRKTSKITRPPNTTDIRKKSGDIVTRRTSQQAYIQGHMGAEMDDIDKILQRIVKQPTGHNSPILAERLAPLNQTQRTCISQICHIVQRGDEKLDETQFKQGGDPRLNWMELDWYQSRFFCAEIPGHLMVKICEAVGHVRLEMVNARYDRLVSERVSNLRDRIRLIQPRDVDKMLEDDGRTMKSYVDSLRRDLEPTKDNMMAIRDKEDRLNKGLHWLDWARETEQDNAAVRLIKKQISARFGPS